MIRPTGDAPNAARVGLRRSNQIEPKPMAPTDLKRVRGMATLETDIGIPYRPGGTIGLFPNTLRELLGHIGWLEQSREYAAARGVEVLADRVRELEAENARLRSAEENRVASGSAP